MVELADSLDSGSSVQYARAGSSPASRTKQKSTVFRLKQLKLGTFLLFCFILFCFVKSYTANLPPISILTVLSSLSDRLYRRARINLRSGYMLVT